jgi:hypothetical protein
MNDPDGSHRPNRYPRTAGILISHRPFLEPSIRNGVEHSRRRDINGGQAISDPGPDGAKTPFAFGKVRTITTVAGWCSA